MNETTDNDLDFVIDDGGSVVLFHPMTDAAKEWAEEHVGPDNGFQPYWPTIVCEARYAMDLADGMIGDGLIV